VNDGKKVTKLSTLQVAKLLGVSDQSVANWVDSGQLRAGRTPGGHRRVEPDDLVDFLKRQKLRVPSGLVSARPTILVVDDHKEAASHLVNILQAECAEYRVLVAHDGFAAGQLIAAERPDVVLLDFDLPGVDGSEVCRRIKADPRTRNISLIMLMAADASSEAQMGVLDAGASACVSVPIDAETVCQLVRELAPLPS
jgi:two-component system, OmpR family, response regulator